jgi:hypothetical protein
MGVLGMRAECPRHFGFWGVILMREGFLTAKDAKGAKKDNWVWMMFGAAVFLETDNFNSSIRAHPCHPWLKMIQTAPRSFLNCGI